MNKSMLIGAVVGVGGALSLGAVASYKAFSGPQYAEVVSSTPVRHVETTPVQQCEMVSVTRQKPVQDQHQLVGTAIGAVVGGVVGHQFGNGRGQDVATVAGAAAGGFAGNRIQKGMQDRDTYTTQEQRCRTVQQKHERIVGWDVKYTLDGKPGEVRMSHQPTGRIPVKDGKLVLDAPAAAPEGKRG